jgi:hypothetical protein
MSTEVVNSYNIFIDTERDINATSMEIVLC